MLFSGSWTLRFLKMFHHLNGFFSFCRWTGVTPLKTTMSTFWPVKREDLTAIYMVSTNCHRFLVFKIYTPEGGVDGEQRTEQLVCKDWMFWGCTQILQELKLSYDLASRQTWNATCRWHFPQTVLNCAGKSNSNNGKTNEVNEITFCWLKWQIFSVRSRTKKRPV